MTHDIRDYVGVLQRLLDAGTSFVTVTLLQIRGSAPQVVGAKAVVTGDDIEAGSVGGGKIEAAAIHHAQAMLQGNGPHCEMLTWNLQTEIGMTCGGEVTLFFERFTNHHWPIVVFGAGHVAQALIPLLVQLNCHVTCVDTRPEWLDKLSDHPKLEKVCPASPPETVASQPKNAYFVLMSKGHATDLPVLVEILNTRDAPYVGVIGSQQKANTLKRELQKQGVASAKIESFFCPLGLPIGDNTPVEIAISVVAQLIQQRDRVAATGVDA